MILELKDILHTGPATMEDAPNAASVRILDYHGQYRCQVYDGLWRYFAHDGESLGRIHATKEAALHEARELQVLMAEILKREADKEAEGAWLAQVFGDA